MIDPEPAVVPVKVTVQLVTPAVVDSIHVGELREPPVVPGVNVKVTVPPGAAGAFGGVVVSVTAAVTVAVQLVALTAMLQLTFPTLVDVLSFATVIVFDAGLVLPL